MKSAITRATDRLYRNVEAFQTGKISYDTFVKRQIKIWDSINAADPGLGETMLGHLRSKRSRAESEAKLVDSVLIGTTRRSRSGYV